MAKKKARPQVLKLLFLGLTLSIGLLVVGQKTQFFSEATHKRPVLTRVAPTSANAMETITLSGKYFGKRRGQVLFSASGASTLGGPIVSWSDTTITVRVPGWVASDTSYTIKVKTQGGRQSNGLPIAVKKGLPMVLGFPRTAKVGVQIQLTGQRFSDAPGRVTLKLLNSETVHDCGISSWTDIAISCTIPTLSAGGYLVQVTTVDKLSSPVHYITVTQ